MGPFTLLCSSLRAQKLCEELLNKVKYRADKGLKIFKTFHRSKMLHNYIYLEVRCLSHSAMTCSTESYKYCLLALIPVTQAKGKTSNQHLTFSSGSSGTLVESSSRFVWSAMKRTPSIALCSSGQWCQWVTRRQRGGRTGSSLSGGGGRSSGHSIAGRGGVPWMRQLLPSPLAASSL